MNAKQAVDRLKPEEWAATPALERLHLLEAVRENMKTHADELAAADAVMKNGILGEEIVSLDEGMIATGYAMGNTISATIELYESIVHGELPKPISVTQVKDDRYDIHVFPQHAKDRLLNADRKDVLRVKGEPKQVNPLDKPAGIIAVSGAGNFSSAVEMVKALFWENCAVAHKPHRLNEETDKVWAKVFAPLVEVGALSFCDASEGRALMQDPRLSKIYFTGGTSTAQAIMNATDAEVVSECGGNNPCILVPGDRPWTAKEIQHQAIQIATAAKLNGGAVCGRPQTLVTSEYWPQREAFLDALRKAIVDETPAAGTYYPGADDVMAAFKENHPDAEVLQPEGGKHASGEFLVITGVAEDAYAVTHEAFCQIINEVPLDAPANAENFLPAAVEFCNAKLHGTLGCMILIDEDTKKAHREVLDEAVTDLDYGGIAINTIPPFVFFNPYLTWGGNEEGKTFVSGLGHFGNLLNYENVEKSIIEANFISPGHMMNTNRADMNAMSRNMAHYAVSPTWMNLTRLMAGAVAGRFRHKDF